MGFHVHRFHEVFSRQKGAVRYLECACGQRKATAKPGTTPERPPAGWPDPFTKVRPSRRKARNSTTISFGNQMP